MDDQVASKLPSFTSLWPSYTGEIPSCLVNYQVESRTFQLALIDYQVAVAYYQLAHLDHQLAVAIYEVALVNF